MKSNNTSPTSKPTSVDEILEPLKRGAGIAQRNEAAAKINRLITEARRQEVESLVYKAKEHTITDIEMIQHHTRGKVDFIEAVETIYFAKRLIELTKELGDSNE
jgi:hypothetical protein